ncbi:MAG: glycosyltransferase family 1 protein, partial [Proteobacteria bacterium]|nr:glycosyltransferase family 1 protein [Pseudomonadota bacterium]
LPTSLPSVVGVSNLAPFSDNARDVESWLVRLKMTLLKHSIIAATRRANKVVAISATCKDVLTSHGIEPSKISVIPNGVDPFWSQPSTASNILNENGIAGAYLLYVSHFYRYRNHQRLVHAYAMLPASTRAAHQLVLVGKPADRRYFDEVLELRSRLGLDRDVVVISGVSGERLRHLYQRARLFVFPSLIENCPNILLEAMAAGAPVLASSLQPMPEFGGPAVEYFNPLDAEGMAQKIGMLLSSQKVVDEMKGNSTRQAQRFSWDLFVQEVVELCHLAKSKQNLEK